MSAYDKTKCLCMFIMFVYSLHKLLPVHSDIFPRKVFQKRIKHSASLCNPRCERDQDFIETFTLSDAAVSILNRSINANKVFPVFKVMFICTRLLTVHHRHVLDLSQG